MKALPYLIRKEFLQFRRNAFLPRLVLVMPLMLMLVFPWAATQEVKDLRVTIVDQDHSAESRRLAEEVVASAYFQPDAYAPTYEAALRRMRRGESDVILQVERGFGRNVYRTEAPHLLVAANAVNGTQGQLGAAYLQQIIAQHGRRELDAKAMSAPAAGTVSAPAVEQRYLFNPTLDYKRFMLPALLTTLILLITGFLPALNIVSEKERGTISQINVTPVGRTEFILGKLIPYWIIGVLEIALALVLMRITYGFGPAGSLLTLWVFAAVFVMLMSGFGLLVSNFSQTMQQAMLVMFFFVLVFLLISGVFTPVRSMPDWAQAIAACNPLKYFAEAMRMIFLKGSGLADLRGHLLMLAACALVIDTAAVLTYRKRA